MKTVKLLQKVNIVFLLMILLMALATLANHVFGQTPQWEQAQVYGDSSLVDFDIEFYQDSAAIKFPASDKDVKEIVVIAYPDDKELPADEKVWIIKDMNDVGGITFYGITYTFIKTSKGVTCLYYAYEKKNNEGWLALNGKIVARYVFDKKVISGNLMGVPSDIWKGDTFWRYQTGRP